MTQQRARDIARRMLEDDRKLIAYPAIVELCEELGIPMAVRTLRFYVAEGVLPLPRRQGKTPVYPRDWIVGALLAIHLLKARLQVPLAHIRRIFERLEDPPEVLAELCQEIDTLQTRAPGRYRDVRDRFLDALIAGQQPGDLPVETMSPAAQAVNHESTSHESTSHESTSHESTSHESTSHESTSHESLRRLAPRVELDVSNAPSNSSVVDGPRRVGDSASGWSDEPGRVSRDQAREYESRFIRSFEAEFGRLEEIYHPLEDKYFTIKASDLDPVITDEYLHVVDELKRAGRFDRALFETLPLDKSTRYELSLGGLLARKRTIVVIGANWSPLEEFVRRGSCDRRAGGADLFGVLDRVLGNGEAESSVDASLEKRGVYCYVGIHSTVGWEPEVVRYLPGGRNYSVALIEYDDTAGWRVHDAFPEKARDLSDAFDPEPYRDKIDRLGRRLESRRELASRGGFVEVDDLEREWGVSADIMNEAIETLVESSGDLSLRSVRGKRILQRDRLRGS